MTCPGLFLRDENATTVPDDRDELLAFLVLFDRAIVQIKNDAVDVGTCGAQIVTHLAEDTLPVKTGGYRALWSGGAACRHYQGNSQAKNQGKISYHSTTRVRTHGSLPQFGGSPLRSLAQQRGEWVSFRAPTVSHRPWWKVEEYVPGVVKSTNRRYRMGLFDPRPGEGYDLLSPVR